MAVKKNKQVKFTSKDTPTTYIYKKTKLMREKFGSEWPNYRLMWPITLYKEWYCFEKLANKTKSKTFEEWFNLNKYAEPSSDKDVKIIKQKNSKVTIEFDITHDLKRLGFNFLKIMKDLKAEYTLKSLAKIQPSKKAADFTLNTSKERRNVYWCKRKKIKNLEIAKKLKLISKEVYDYKTNTKGISNKEKQSKYPDADFLESQYLKAERKIQRHNADCKIILENIEKGVFP